MEFYFAYEVTVLKTKLNVIFCFYKTSVKEIFGYMKYMTKKILKYHLVIAIVVIVVWYSQQYLGAKDFERLTGVLISIVDAILFEGYR